MLWTRCDRPLLPARKSGMVSMLRGKADFILIFNVSDMSEYQRLTRTLFFESGHTKRFTTSVVMDTIKTNSHVLL